MILQGVKPTIQPLGVGYENGPQKRGWHFPVSNNLCEEVFQPTHTSLKTAKSLTYGAPYGGRSRNGHLPARKMHMLESKGPRYGSYGQA